MESIADTIETAAKSRRFAALTFVRMNTEPLYETTPWTFAWRAARCADRHLQTRRVTQAQSITAHP